MFVIPATSSIISESGSPDEQGKLQGLLTGVRALAGGLAPLLVNPLTAVFFSANAPFDCPGIAYYVIAGIEALAVILALFLPSGGGSDGRRHVQLASQDGQAGPEETGEREKHSHKVEALFMASDVERLQSAA
eukprot:TRINITY_DN225_c0_g2_i1.p1 TRINITY_DN225_c0_g2~~TRINITY_DN225_c0_g2_i1.p1  ORF type:complete len:133 (-),score=23.65 TRINITY_DN225_c0_g2_i1:442-840(-)